MIPSPTVVQINTPYDILCKFTIPQKLVFSFWMTFYSSWYKTQLLPCRSHFILSLRHSGHTFNDQLAYSIQIGRLTHLHNCSMAAVFAVCGAWNPRQPHRRRLDHRCGCDASLCPMSIRPVASVFATPWA